MSWSYSSQEPPVSAPLYFSIADVFFMNHIVQRNLNYMVPLGHNCRKDIILISKQVLDRMLIDCEQTFQFGFKDIMR